MTRQTNWDFDTDWNTVDLTEFAAAWLETCGNDEPPIDNSIGVAVTAFTFRASPELQWKFIEIAVQLAKSVDDLCAIAAGPVEKLLGDHGDDYIACVEARCVADAKFRRMVCGVWQYEMTDEVWGRVQALQALDHNQWPYSD
ncbi:MAG TPA: hypothetical protein VGL66_15430 [Caulobacteraceae bacterium]|jgi:hypothetical protein